MPKKKYEDEVLKSISIVCEKSPDVELGYFCKVWREFWIGVPQSKTPYIAVTDMVGVPELYIRASGAKPLFLFGGNYFIDEYTEGIFPQVSDPVVKSTSSMLFTRNIPYIQNIMAVVVPVRSVSARKIVPYLCDAGYKVIVMEQEPFLSTKVTSQFKAMQMDFLRQLQQITHQHISVKSLYNAAEQITKAHNVLQRLDVLNIPEIAKSFIRQTYYVASDMDEWIQNVEALIASNESNLILEYPPGLLLTGSSVFFPNTKIPSVLQDVGIINYVNNCGVPYPENYSVLFDHGTLTKNSLLEILHEIHYKTVKNDIAHSIYVNTSFMQNTGGVIYHLLKGQLMYAYEAELTEKAAIRAGVPFVCVETDYTDADVEQIRIRLEAFSELLQQTPLKKVSFEV